MSGQPLVHAVPEGQDRFGRALSARAGRSRSAVLGAAADLLERYGWQGFAVEAVARRAQVGKATVYRLWGGRSELALQALGTLLERSLVLPDTGCIREDLYAYLESMARMMDRGGTGRVLASVLAAAQEDEELATAYRELFLQLRADHLATLLARGVRRGELRPDVDLRVVADLASGALHLRLLVQHAPLVPGLVHEIVDSLLDGLRVRPTLVADGGARSATTGASPSRAPGRPGRR